MKAEDDEECTRISLLDKLAYARTLPRTIATL